MKHNVDLDSGCLLQSCPQKDINLAFGKIIEKMNLNINAKIVFNDGSKNMEGVGASFWCPTNKICGKHKLHNQASIFTPVAVAISQALSYLLQEEILMRLFVLIPKVYWVV